jgi:predicted flap endonuclease-1-like 5' DNA nuclease
LPVTRNRSQPAIDTRRKPDGYKTEEIEGVGPAYAQKLAAANIETTADLLKQCCAAKGRKATAQTTGVSE